MNCKVVTMYKSEDNYYAEYLENKEECDASRIDYDNGYTSIEKYLSYEDGRVGNLIESDDWSKENNLLKLIINDKEAIPESEIKEIKWLTNVGEKVTNEKEYLARTELIIDSEFYAQIELNVTDKAGNVCHQQVTVKRDETKPTCSYTGESTSWTGGDRTISLSCQDNLSECVKTNIATQHYNSTLSTAPFGTYQIEDKAGNSNTCDRNVNVYIDKCDSSRAIYGSWSSCSASCGGGTQSRSISYQSTTGSGFICPANGRSTSESANCNTQSCSSGGGDESGEDKPTKPCPSGKWCCPPSGMCYGYCC